jgi:hypothetical protein
LERGAALVASSQFLSCTESLFIYLFIFFCASLSGTEADLGCKGEPERDDSRQRQLEAPAHAVVADLGWACGERE